MVNNKRSYKMVPYKRKSYKMVPYKKKQVAKNTRAIARITKAVVRKCYFKHNDAARVQTVFPNTNELNYREFTPIQPTLWNPLFNNMIDTELANKILIKKMKLTITLTLGNITQAEYPIDYSVFVVRIKPALRAQFYADAGMNGTALLEGVHYTGDIAPFKPPNLLNPTKENIRLNPDIFEILHYKHGYFSTVVKNSTAVGTPDPNRITKLQVRRINKTFKINKTLKSDSYSLAGVPNRAWKDLEEQEIPLWMRIHVYTFTSAEKGTPAYIEQTGLQQQIQCLFTCNAVN